MSISAQPPFFVGYKNVVELLTVTATRISLRIDTVSGISHIIPGYKQHSEKAEGQQNEDGV